MGFLSPDAFGFDNNGKKKIAKFNLILNFFYKKAICNNVFVLNITRCNSASHFSILFISHLFNFYCQLLVRHFVSEVTLSFPVRAEDDNLAYVSKQFESLIPHKEL